MQNFYNTHMWRYLNEKVLEIYYLAMRVTRIIWVRFLHRENNKFHIRSNLLILVKITYLYLIKLGINIKPSLLGSVVHPSITRRLALGHALLTGKLKFPALGKVGHSRRGRFYSSKACILNSNPEDKGLPQPVATYSDIEAQKSAIYLDNKNKAGVYKWTNKTTGSSYIGSSVNLSKRFTNYFSISFLIREVAKVNSVIYKALLKYGLSNFQLEILEYCKPEDVLAREQYYLDLCSPKYNILTRAGSSYGFKHSAETLAKFKERKVSPEALEKMRTHLATHNIEMNKNKRFKVDIYDIVTDKNSTFSSLKEAASTINSHSKTLSERCNLDLEKGVCLPYRGRYVITIYKDGITSSDHFKKVELARLRGEEGHEAWKAIFYPS